VSLTIKLTAADNVATVFPLATVTLLPSGTVRTSDNNGNCTFSGLSSMPQAVQVNPAYQPNYTAVQVDLPPMSQTSLTVNIALLPHAVGTVTSISLNPQDQKVEVGDKAHVSEVQFTATIVTDQGTTGLRPTWFCVGTAGSLDNNGIFTATALGECTIYASSGDKFTSTTATVVSPTGPAIITVLVDPPHLPATGGLISITAPITDPYGVTSVQGLIFQPSGKFAERPMHLVASTTGTYRVVYQVPPNSNPPNAKGAQPPEVYRIRVRAVDSAGRVSLSRLVPFTELGLPAPPPPPS
jgi:hypothetical protein